MIKLFLPLVEHGALNKMNMEDIAHLKYKFLFYQWWQDSMFISDKSAALIEILIKHMFKIEKEKLFQFSESGAFLKDMISYTEFIVRQFYQF